MILLISLLGIESNDGTPKLKGCHTEKVQGYKVEVCFCQDQFCNGASTVSALVFTVAGLSLLTATLSRLM